LEVVFIEQNIKGDFRRAELVPFNSDTMILKLNIKL